MTIRQSPPSASGTGDSTESHFKRFPWLLLVLLLCILPLCFLGYGTDNDTYGVLEAGRSTWLRHFPATSRNPGYWTYEAIIYVLSTLGGSVLSNLGSFTVATLVVWRFWALAQRLRIPYSALLAASLIVSPGFLIAATSTDDYFWSLLFMVLGAEMLLADRFVAATLLSALAMAIRGGNGPVVAGGFLAAIVYEVCVERRLTPRAIKTAVAAVAAALLAAIAFYPSYVWAGRNMSFTHEMAPSYLYAGWLRLGKFFFKGSVSFGPIAFAVALVAAVLYFIRRHRLRDAGLTPDGRRVAAVCLGYFLGNLVLFLRYPIEFYYLIPATFFFLLLGGITIFRFSRPMAVAFFVAVLSFDFVWPVFARPNVPGHSTGAHLTLGAGPGLPILDARERFKLKDCNDYNCLIERQ